MSIKELEALLEATRQKIADQGRIADARLLEKERMLEQAVIDAHLDAPTRKQVELPYKPVMKLGDLDAEPDTSNCKKCRVVIKNGGDWGYCTCCYEETRAEEEQDDE